MAIGETILAHQRRKQRQQGLSVDHVTAALNLEARDTAAVRTTNRRRRPFNTGGGGALPQIGATQAVLRGLHSFDIAAGGGVPDYNLYGDRPKFFGPQLLMQLPGAGDPYSRVLDGERIPYQPVGERPDTLGRGIAGFGADALRSLGDPLAAAGTSLVDLLQATHESGYRALANDFGLPAYEDAAPWQQNLGIIGDPINLIPGLGIARPGGRAAQAAARLDPVAALFRAGDAATATGRAGRAAAQAVSRETPALARALAAPALDPGAALRAGGRVLDQLDPTAARATMRSVYEDGPVRARLGAVQDEPGTMALNAIQTAAGTRGGQHANRVMRQITADADASGTRLVLVAEPQGTAGLSKERLLRWYETFGFRPTALGDEFLERVPQQTDALYSGLPIPTPRQVVDTTRQAASDVAAGARAIDRRTTLPREIVESADPSRLYRYLRDRATPGRRAATREADDAAADAARQGAHPLSTKLQIMIRSEMRLAHEARETTESFRHVRRQDQTRQLADLQASDLEGDAYEAARSKILAGEQPVMQMRPDPFQADDISGVLTRMIDDPLGHFRPLSDRLSQAEQKGLYDIIRADPVLSPWEKLRTEIALKTLLRGYIPPQRNQLDLLDQAFGPAFTRDMRLARTWRQKGRDVILDVTGIPKSMLASFDLSAPLRQGMMGIAYPREWLEAWGPMLRSWGNREVAAEVDDVLWGGPNTRAAAAAGDRNARLALEAAKLRRRSGLDKSSLGANLSAREEAFQSTIAERIPIIGPIIAASNRAYTNYLNVLRANLFDMQAKRLRAAELPPAELERELRDVAKVINVTMGRGHLPETWRNSDLLVLLNRTFFSPRWTLSRAQAIQLAGQAAIPSGAPGGLAPTARKMIARQLIGFAAVTTGVLGAIKLFGGDALDVEIDPRSSDFGKITLLDKTRFDMLGGLQPFIRYAAQLATGEAKALGTGNIYDIDRTDTLLRFGRGRLDPGIPSILVNIFTGETFMGANYEDVVSQTPGTELRERLIPLAVADAIDAIDEFGPIGALFSAPGLIGIGSATYQSRSEERAEEDEAAYARLTEAERQGTETLADFREKVGGKVADEILDRHRSPEEQDARAERAEEARAAAERPPSHGDQHDWRNRAQVAFQDGVLRAAADHADDSLRFAREVKRHQGNLRAALELAQIEYPEPDTEEGQDRHAWYALFDDADAISRETGEGYADVFDRLEGELIDRIGADRYRRILENVYAVTWDDAPPMLRDYQETKLQLALTGYFDIAKNAWAYVQRAKPETAGYASFFAYRDAEVARLLPIYADHPEIVKLDPEWKEDFLADRWTETNAIAKGYSKIKNRRETEWVSQHARTDLRPGYGLVNAARAFGYYTPTLPETSAINRVGLDRATEPALP